MTRPDTSTRRRSLAAAVAAFAMACAAPAVLAQPSVERGRALYETRCIACHETSVHQRASRKATDFAALRREVERWSTTLGGEWRAEELDAVTVFLNDRYYRYTCPPAVCRGQARVGAPRSDG
jgi:mono/diheme cytochrome c family protein